MQPLTKNIFKSTAPVLSIQTWVAEFTAHKDDSLEAKGRE
jgi:hypothetical protein